MFKLADEGEKFMPKIKTNRAAAKRFKKTGTGKIVFRKSCGSHILTKKTTKRKRSLCKPQISLPSPTAEKYGCCCPTDDLAESIGIRNWEFFRFEHLRIHPISDLGLRILDFNKEKALV